MIKTLMAIGLLCACAVAPAYATDPADMETWYASEPSCSVTTFLLIKDEKDPNDRVALVSFNGAKGVVSVYAKWLRSDTTLALSDFADHRSDTFTGTFTNRGLSLVHVLPAKTGAAPKTEICTFVQG